MKKYFVALGFILVFVTLSALLGRAWFRARQVTYEQARAEEAAREAKLHKDTEPTPVPVVVPEPAVPAPSLEPASPSGPALPKTIPRRDRPSAASRSGVPNPGGKQVKDEMARMALRFVGADPEAEQYWFEAINDPNLPAKERQDLIEDLNEDGLSDPKHPTADDLPLILNRLHIIELVAWNSLDQVNADAFMEAYKDLVNLAELAQGGGEPVK